MPGEDVLLKLKDVYAGYSSNKIVLRGVNLEAKKSQTIIITGPNGSGKTTLLKTIAGLTKIFSGKLLFNEGDGRPEPPLRGIGLVLNPHPLVPSLTVKENLEIILQYRKKQNLPTADIDEIVNLVGIVELLGKKALELSSGERQLVGIAQALLTVPRILLLDEPLAHLDSKNTAKVSEAISNIVQRGDLCILAVFHEVLEASFLKPYKLIVLEHGRVVWEGGYHDTLGSCIISTDKVVPSIPFSFIEKGSNLYYELHIDKVEANLREDPGRRFVGVNREAFNIEPFLSKPGSKQCVEARVIYYKPLSGNLFLVKVLVRGQVIEIGPVRLPKDLYLGARVCVSLSCKNVGSPYMSTPSS